MERSRQNLIFLCFSQLTFNFSLSFITVFLPFFIIRTSPYSTEVTLLWVGAIVGSANLCSAATSTFWGSLTHRYSPKLLYLRGIAANAVMFFLMGFTTSLPMLLTLRILLGLAGGISTIGMIMVSSSSPKERIPADIGLYQSFIMLGNLVGPPVGSFAAAMLGYRGAFVSASAVLVASSIFFYLFVADIPRLPRREKNAAGGTVDRRILVAWMVCFAVSIQLGFLPSVLPNVFEAFHIERTIALKQAGMVVLLYTATAMIGTYVWTQVARRFGLYRIISFLLILGTVLQALLAFGKGMIDFTLIRMIQTGVVTATVPLTISTFAGEAKGGRLGFLNSSRFTGSALGPMIATSILAASNLATVYFFISGISLVAFLGFILFFKKGDSP